MSTSTSANTSKFANLIVKGGGFINRLRKVALKKGSFIALTFEGQYGEANENGYFETSRFNVIVKSKEAKEIFEKLLVTYDQKNDKIFAAVDIGDVRADVARNADGSLYMADVYKDGKKTGEKDILPEIKGSLVGLRYLSVNGTVVFQSEKIKETSASTGAASDEAAEPSTVEETV